MSAVNIFVSIYIAMEKTFCVLGDDRTVIVHLLYFSKVIPAIHLPAPILQETYMEGIFRT